MIISLIVAVGNDNVMGLNNQLPWRLPADLKYFKAVTNGHHIIMGRKTFDSLGKPLPNRINVVITRQNNFAAEGVEVFNNIDDAIALVKKNNETEAFIIGGSEIFKQSMQQCNRMYITRIHHSFEGDTFFPEINNGEWKLVKSETHQPDEKNLYSYTFEVYERR